MQNQITKENIMKKFAIALVILMLCTLVVPVSADGVPVLKGTPVVDGVLDDIYLQSAVTIQPHEALNPYIWGGYSDEIYNNGQTYLLWDEDYLYLCTVMEDTTPYSAGEGAGWQNDCSEHWFVDEDLSYKVHIAADGNFFLGTDADGATPYDFEESLSAAKWTDDTHFCTEIALPLNDLAAGREFTHRMQYNNIVGADTSVGYAINTGDEDYVCVADEVVLPEAETEPETVADVAEETTQAPQTFDAGIIAAVAAIVSAAGYTIAKKR